MIDYDSNSISEKHIEKIEDCFNLKDTSTVSWINIDGIHDTEIIEKLGSHFLLHPLLLEDIVNTNQRTKVEHFDEYLFLTLKMLTYDTSLQDIQTEQVSFILSKNYVLSFQEKEGDVFTPIRERLKASKGKIRTKRTDYLFYALLDMIVDTYFSIIEEIGFTLDALEDEIFYKPTKESLYKIQKNKKSLSVLRQSIYPLREAIHTLQKDESGLIENNTLKYIGDVYDHILQLIETIESYKETLTGLKDMYLSSISQKMNQVMQMLTIISTIFIPLTFIAGIYGMNFDSMPELHWKYGYFIK